MAFSDELGLTLGQRFVCFFVSIATILGTGILALPVKLDECGFAPFTLTFTISLFAQVYQSQKGDREMERKEAQCGMRRGGKRCAIAGEVWWRGCAQREETQWRVTGCTD